MGAAFVLVMKSPPAPQAYFPPPLNFDLIYPYQSKRKSLIQVPLKLADLAIRLALERDITR